MVDTLLSVRGLNKQFQSGDEPVPVLVDLSLHLEAGESLALTGRSGSGKSTLLNILCGLEKPDAGVVMCSARRSITGQCRPAERLTRAGAIYAGSRSVWFSRKRT